MQHLQNIEICFQHPTKKEEKEKFDLTIKALAQCTNLKKINIFCNDRIANRYVQGSLVTLLSGPNLPKLTEIALKDSILTQNLEKIISARKNILTKLWIESNIKLNKTISLLAQFTKLNSLNIKGGFTDFSRLSQIKSLTTLTIELTFIKMHPRDWKKLRPKTMPNLSELNLYCKYRINMWHKWDRVALLENFTLACPNLNIFTFHDDGGNFKEEHLVQIARNCPKLEHLLFHSKASKDQLVAVLEDLAKMRKLHHLHLCSFKMTERNCQKLMKTSKQIKTIHVENKLFAREDVSSLSEVDCHLYQNPSSSIKSHPWCTTCERTTTIKMVK